MNLQFIISKFHDDRDDDELVQQNRMICKYFFCYSLLLFALCDDFNDSIVILGKKIFDHSQKIIANV